MHYLEQLTKQYGSSVEQLRRIAFERCALPYDSPRYAVDFWLYETLCVGLALGRSDFSLRDEESVLLMIERALTLRFKSGRLTEKCAASWAEVVSFPIERYRGKHEALLYMRIARKARQDLFSSPF